MIMQITNRSIRIVGAILFALLLGGFLFAGTVSAHGGMHGGSSGMHGMMGYGMGATASVTNAMPYGYHHGGWCMQRMMGYGMGAMPHYD
jgi:hypothetical protein